MLFSQVIPPLPSPTESKSLFFISVSLENSMDRGAWWSTVHGVAKSQTHLSTHTVLNVIFQIELFFSVVELYELFVYLEIKPLLATSFANVFTYSVDCLFILLMISFAVQMLASLTRSYLFIFIFGFISIALGD